MSPPFEARIAELARAGDWFEAAIATPQRARHAEVDGARLHAVEWGDPHRDAPWLVFVHGFRGHAHWWDAVAPLFAADYRVLSLDLSGMGDSERRPFYNGDIYAADIYGTVEQLCETPVTIVGHSFGGSRVMRAAGLRPQLFRQVIIVDSYVILPGDSLPDEPPSRGRVYPDRETALSRFRLLPMQPEATPAILRHIAEHSVRQVEGGWTWKFDVNLPTVGNREGDGAALLAALTMPVDYVCGERSVVVAPQLAQRIAAALPRGRGPIVIPNGHHHLMIDQPIALTSTLRALLARRHEGASGD